MTDYIPNITSSSAAVNIYNGAGEQSYPLAYMSFITISRISAPVINCNRVGDTLPFIVWTQLNDNAAAVANGLGYVSLLDPYRKRLIDSLGSVTCQSEKVLSTAYIQGYGDSLPIFDYLARRYTDGSLVTKYFQRDTTGLFDDLSRGDIDFAGSETPLSDQQSTEVPWIKAVPVCSFYIMPGANIPSINTTYSLVLDLSTIAGIFLNNITNWNDERIAKLNPSIVLPDAQITVAIVSDQENMIYETLSLVPGFTNLVHPPVPLFLLSPPCFNLLFP